MSAKSRVVAMAGGVILLVFLTAVTIVNGAGFSDKTLFDWLGVLVFPIVIAAGGFWLEQVQRRRDEQIQSLREEEEKQGALVQAYLEQMAELMVTYDLRASGSDTDMGVMARAATLNVLSQVNSFRKGVVIRFLYESRLINGNDPIIVLAGADLSQVFLQATFLRDAALSRTTLNDAELREADLSGADLAGAYMSGANLTAANLRDANLIYANLRDANLMYAYLGNADLTGADLRGANLRDANLRDANLRDANLQGRQPTGSGPRGSDAPH
jgi:Pentapeptide repeats (8 copies)